MVPSGDGPPEFTIVLVPTAEFVIDRTWDTAGMRGTGSHTLVADEIFVPQERVLPIPKGPGGAPDFFAGRPATVLAGAMTLLAPLVGAARGALDVVGSILHRRRPPMTQYDSLAVSPGARHWFADATQLIESAQHDLVVLAQQVQNLLPSPTLDPRDSSAIRLRALSVVRRCQDGVNLLLDLNGASSFAVDNPLQRFWRDLHVGSRHMQFNPYIALENHAGLLADAQAATKPG